MDPKEARIYTAVIISAIVIGIIILYFALSIVRQQKRNVELQNSIILSEISALEKERARIAADMHDELSPVLSVVKFQVENTEVENTEGKLQLRKASAHLDDILKQVREIANDLMPGTLLRKGLIEAVQEFISRVVESRHIDIQFSYPGELQLSQQVSINMYRAIQELIHNCIKHAKAEKIEITIEIKKGFLSLMCRDNGIGFDYEHELLETKGLGLNSLKNRASIMGGTMIVESKQGKGSAFLFEIPIN